MKDEVPSFNTYLSGVPEGGNRESTFERFYRIDERYYFLDSGSLTNFKSDNKNISKSIPRQISVKLKKIKSKRKV